MKENLKIRFNDFERQEVINLLRSIGKTLHDGAEKRWHEISIIYIYAKYDKLEWDTDSGDIFLIDDAKEITLPELRELARPKEYLNDKFELVVTNQPLEGYRKIPDNANIFFLAKDGYSFFWGKGKQHYDDGRFCDSSMHNFSQRCEIHLKKILWQRENKVEAVKGRFLHQEWYEAFGRGEDVQYDCKPLQDFTDVRDTTMLSAFNDPDCTFRLKPKTITIGSRTINKPISVKPEIGTEYFMPSLSSSCKYLYATWNDSNYDKEVLGRSLCHLTKEDAISHCEALLELMK